MRPLVTMLLISFLAGCGQESAELQGLVSSWQLPRHDTSQPSPRSVHYGHDGRLYALDTIGRVIVMNPENGELLQQWMMPETSVGRPEGLCLLRDGRLAVSDTHYHRVVLFNIDGSVSRIFGSKGTEAGQFIYPVAIDQDEDGNLYVAEYGSNDRIQVFDLNGSFLRAFGSFGTGDKQFQRPAGIRCHKDLVYIADAMNHRVQVFRRSGEHLSSIEAGLYLPYDLSIDDQENLHVVEYGNGQVSQFDREGRLISRTGSNGNGQGQFITPWGCDVHQNILWVADTGNRRIVRWELP